MNIKLIIWDLDDTLWRGTLAEGDDVQLHESRAGIIRALNQCGIVSAICSKNDFASAQRMLGSFDLWDEFVFPRIAFVPKGAAVKQIIEDMHLRPVNVLFIDDNPHNLHEVKTAVPEIQVLDATSEDTEVQLQTLLDDSGHVTKSRVEEYRILQAKVDDRQSGSASNEDFLRSCDIHAAYAFRMDMLDFTDRIAELVNRSNQLNYTQSRLEPGTVGDMIMNVRRYNTWSVFVWDKYGYYGLVGFMAVERTAIPKLIHFVFSCRVMHMGIEQAMLSVARQMFPALDTSAMVLPFTEGKSDWIKIVDFHSPSIRNDIRTKDLHAVRPESAAMRIMFDCQSGGIAHFSKYREVIDFDNFPRLFSLFSTFGVDYGDQVYPPALVYGAGIDYVDVRWPADAIPSIEDNFRASVSKFCSLVGSRSCKLLVVLPPENMPESKYHLEPIYDFTPAKAVRFNNVWRECAEASPFIELLDLSDLAEPDDIADISHYYAGFLQKIAKRVDGWYESIALTRC